MVYGIVKSHGGHIVCASEAGRGTTFSIYFPVADRVELPVAVNRSKETLQQGKETILLVDDEELIRSFASKLLENHGYTVLTAEDGLEALEVFRRERERISLVLLDLIMPRMGGKACFEELLRMDPGLKVLISSGYSQDGGREDYVAAGARAFLTKPYAAQELLSMVRRALDERC
jgi:CheY-like chemotaxis protein